MAGLTPEEMRLVDPETPSLERARLRLVRLVRFLVSSSGILIAGFGIAIALVCLYFGIMFSMSFLEPT